ncbi:MAG: HD domain-containing protein [Gemmatimonadetes bacterium]|nr:HD domain-containing protein [Gemmatimonadota bacterium]
MMLSGRILLVSDRDDVVAELEPMIRAGQHMASVVPDGSEAMKLLAEGMVPDVVISDVGSERSLEGIGYVRRFRELNRAGGHLVVTEPGAPLDRRPEAAQERFAVLPRPFRSEEVQRTLDAALQRMEAEFRTLRAEVWRSMDRLRREVVDARAEMVKALAMTIAARDHFMHGHCERVADTCRAMAVALHLADEDAELLVQAAQLHEIGKMSVPLELLQKTAPLSTEELERIRSHTRVGAGIVRGIPTLRRLAPLIEHHMTDHCELAGEIAPISPEFLLTGILRVVDAWDAMTSERSYRPALPRAYWEPFIRAGAGTRFHPRAVATLMRILPR